MPAKTVDLVLSNPWREPGTEKVHDVGARVSVDPDLAGRLVTGGIALPAKAAPKARKSAKSVKATAIAKPASVQK